MRKFCLRPTAALLLLIAIATAGGWLFRFEIQYVLNCGMIEAASARHPEVPATLIAAVIWQETRFSPSRVGLAGEIGLMQVTPQSGREWAKAEHVADFTSAALFDPSTNVLAGTWYLARAIRRWAGRPDTLALALAEYNAGHSNANRWASTEGNTVLGIDYPSTRRYVRNILRRYEAFGRPWRLIFHDD